MAYLQNVLRWILDHPAEMWIALSAVVNILLRIRSPTSWVAMAEKTRIGAAILGVFRYCGVDPVGAILWTSRAVSAKAAHLAVLSLSHDDIMIAAPDSPPAAPHNGAGGGGGGGGADGDGGGKA